jgi:hypothetical protein
MNAEMGTTRVTEARHCVPFAEPPIRGRVHEGAQLPARLQHRGVPMGRLQVARRHGAQVLLQEALLILDSAVSAATTWMEPSSFHPV